MFYSLALGWDPVHRRVDLQVDPATGALVVDTTAVTPLLMALGTDRRAEPDDELPDGATEGSIQAGFVQRRGWAGDRLRLDGGFCGSRLWLLDRAKLAGRGEDVQTLLLAEDYAAEATAGFPDRFGVEAAAAATRPATNAMQLTVHAGGKALAVNLAPGLATP